MQQLVRQQHNEDYIDRVFLVEARVIGVEMMNFCFCIAWELLP